MVKEAIICSVIVIAIIFGNTVTQNYTKESVENLSKEMNGLKSKIEQQEQEKGKQEELKEEVDKIFEDWDDRYEKLAYFIEHDELEKVENSLTSIKSHMETEEYKEVIGGVDESVFLLKHIEDKNHFNWQNIFQIFIDKMDRK